MIYIKQKADVWRRFRIVVFKKVWLLFFLLPVFWQSTSAYAQSPWIFGLHTKSNSSILSTGLFLGQVLVNSSLGLITDGAISGGSNWTIGSVHFINMKDNGELVDYQIANPYTATSYNLFNDMELGLKLGWQGSESPVGLWVFGAYGLNKYRLRFLGEHEYSKHKLQSLRTGLGVKISPLKFLLDEYDWCPIIELGTTYINNFSYKGPNGSDKDQINNGIRTNYGIGAQFGEDSEYGSVMLSLDMAHYNLFNTKYTPDGGFWYPYANFKSKDFIVSLSLTLNLSFD